jgi:TM2 domain-containing membrane protein YozV
MAMTQPQYPDFQPWNSAARPESGAVPAVPGSYGPPNGSVPAQYGPPPGQFASGAGGPAQPQPYGRPAITVVAAKSAAIAAVLSFFWLGLGHLYANRIGVGIALMIYDAFLVILGITFVGLVLAIPLWLISTPLVMYLSARAAADFNRRNGLAPN